MGLQKIAYMITLTAWYVIGLPLACFFSLKLEWGVIGLEAGFGVAVIVLLVSYGTLLWRTDWQNVADKAIERMKQENSHTSVELSH